MELANIWGANYVNSLMIRLILYYKATTEDEDINQLLEEALTYSQHIFDETHKYLEQGGYAPPIGFTDEDVNLNGPKIFTDEYHMLMLNTQALYG